MSDQNEEDPLWYSVEISIDLISTQVSLPVNIPFSLPYAKPEIHQAEQLSNYQ